MAWLGDVLPKFPAANKYCGDALAMVNNADEAVGVALVSAQHCRVAAASYRWHSLMAARAKIVLISNNVFPSAAPTTK